MSSGSVGIDGRGGTKGVFGDGTEMGVHGNSSTGYGVWGASQSSNGVLGTSSTGAGVGGVHQATSGTAPGAYGETKSTASSASGVYGYVSSTSPGSFSAGVRGENKGTGGSGIGVWGSQDGSGWGVLGESASGLGVYGSSTSGVGVYGDSSSSIGIRSRTAGGSGVSPSGNTETRAAIWADSGVSAGLLATTSAAFVGGVRAENNANSGRGLEAYVTGSSATALYASASGSATQAGFFQGSVNITGSLSKGGGSFKIDHPLHPESMYLYHSFVESPDMMNVYNGNVVTDAVGEAVVELPEWFEALNRDFRYQLTVIGEFAQAIVAREISGNSFTIRTDKPGVKVSWQVTGVRHDPWANAHRIPVEETKTEPEQGYYLHPEAYGQPEERSVNWLYNGETLRALATSTERGETTGEGSQPVRP